MLALIPLVGKFRPQLIELTSFKSKLLILNKTIYDDLEKLMKQTSFTLKNLEESLPKKQSTIIKRSFRSSTKPFSLDFMILVDEITVETFYYFRTSELFNI